MAFPPTNHHPWGMFHLGAAAAPAAAAPEQQQQQSAAVVVVKQQASPDVYDGGKGVAVVEQGDVGGGGGGGARPPQCCRGVYFDQMRNLWRANWPEETVIVDRETQRTIEVKRCTRTKGFSAKKYGYAESQRLAMDHRARMINSRLVRNIVYADTLAGGGGGGGATDSTNATTPTTTSKRTRSDNATASPSNKRRKQQHNPKTKSPSTDGGPAPEVGGPPTPPERSLTPNTSDLSTSAASSNADDTATQTPPIDVTPQDPLAEQEQHCCAPPDNTTTPGGGGGTGGAPTPPNDWMLGMDGLWSGSGLDLEFDEVVRSFTAQAARSRPSADLPNRSNAFDTVDAFLGDGGILSASKVRGEDPSSEWLGGGTPSDLQVRTESGSYSMAGTSSLMSGGHQYIETTPEFMIGAGPGDDSTTLEGAGGGGFAPNATGGSSSREEHQALFYEHW